MPAPNVGNGLANIIRKERNSAQIINNKQLKRSSVLRMVIFDEINADLMLRTFALTLSLLFCLAARTAFCTETNDTIVLLNGTVLVANVTDTTNGVTTIMNPKDSSKFFVIENDRIFSIKNKNGESVLYVYDTLIGNEFTVDEMRYFIHGEQDAEKGFKAKGAFWGNALIGAASGVTLGFLSPLPPFAFVALTGVPKVKIDHNSVSNIDYIKHDTYLMGYERVARKKRKFASLIGGVAGLAVGIGTSFVLDKSK
jgi:hypothetical protein